MKRYGPTNCQLAEVYLQLIEATVVVEWDERVYRVVRITIGDWTKNKRAYCRSLLRPSLPPFFQSDALYSMFRTRARVRLSFSP